MQLIGKLALALGSLTALGFAQTTLNVAGPRVGFGSEWRALSVTNQTSTSMADTLNDQQTGQAPDDFVGTAAQGGAFMALGLVNGLPSIGFRFYLAGYNSTGYAGNVRVGLDVTGDGAADIFFGPKLSGSSASQGITFQLATGPGNYSPSTTALGNPFGTIALTADNYNYQALTAAIDPSWTNLGTKTNAVLSFDMPTQSLKQALATANITITDQTFFDILAFTSTQANAINQDLFGSTGISNNTPFVASGGGFSDYYALDGSYRPRPVAPEPATYGAVFTGLAVLLTGCRLRRRPPVRNGRADPGPGGGHPASAAVGIKT